MQFLTGLFGGSGNTILTVVFALGIVLVLIVLAVWLLKWISSLSGNAVRGRNKRLAVVDTLSLDQKRQLVIIRRDDVEHLILVGGPQDLVVESGIEVEDVPVATAPSRRPLPTIARQRPAEPLATVPPVPAPQPQAPVKAPPPEAAPGTLLAELQKSGHPGDRKARVSLRQTGLLRPVTEKTATQSVQNPDAATGQRADSAKEFGNDTASEGNAVEHHDGDQANRN
ncbi:Flagellar biogenesis protein FliO [Devosia lucknowensis]|uniref:Flagellar biogenesis protein FliO n=1 Tax=Devosia lucknowensis TaxID=1096929 RepID=A0A1Y6EUQ4_9HYPH|nr:flagellar biosynthetic protein FliO [Devosia lucknowensis]SMQ66458.1 Flagellar biogenesis protein FliO [Devosia lucknowensis]